MARTRRFVLAATDKDCPHCGGDIVFWQRMADARVGLKCLKCKCRWNANRRLARWGTRCPRYVKT